MATLVPVRFGQQSIQFGNGADPEVFTTRCGIVGISENFNVNTQSDDLPDCDDPDLVSFEAPYKVSVGQSLDLQIQATAENKPFFTELVYESDATTVRHVFNSGALDGYYEGPAILTALSWTSERRGILTGTATLTWQSQPVWEDAA